MDEWVEWMNGVGEHVTISSDMKTYDAGTTPCRGVFNGLISHFPA